MQHQKSLKVLKTVLLTNITSDLLPALELKAFQFQTEKKKKKKKKKGKKLHVFSVFVTTVLLETFKYFYL